MSLRHPPEPRRARLRILSRLGRFAGLLAGALLAAAPAVSAAEAQKITVWPGYVLELPADHCVSVTKGPDFDVYYVREQGAPPERVLLAVYAGYHPDFEPECERPTTRSWTASGLSFESVTGSGGCAEHLVRDPTNSERGSLHVWFGPAARERRHLAERFVSSIRPAQMPVRDAGVPPQCASAVASPTPGAPPPSGG
jgi:hypothetical protein